MKFASICVLILSVGVGAISLGTAQNGEKKGTVKIGLTTPITGPDSTAGNNVKEGVQQAIKDINQEGGILGQKVELVLGDDAGEPRQGVNVAQKLIGEKVLFVIGGLNSGVTKAVMYQYAENNILQITPASTAEEITHSNLPLIFRTCGTDKQQAQVAGEYILKHFKDKKVAFIHDKTPYGKGLADATKKNVHEGGMTEVFNETVNLGEKDLSSIVLKLKAVGADLVYFGGVSREAGLLVRQMREQHLTTVLMGGDALMSTEFPSIGGDVEGTVVTYAPDPQHNPAGYKMIKSFKENNLMPETFAFYAYAAVEIIKQAAEAIQSFDPKAIGSYMHSGKTFKTVLGEVGFNAEGDRIHPSYVVYQWHRGLDGKLSYSPL